MTTSKLPPRFSTFLTELQSRLIAGAQLYGDRSFDRPEGELIGELGQEALDLAGWGFILWERLQRLAERPSRLPVPDEAATHAEKVFERDIIGTIIPRCQENYHSTEAISQCKLAAWHFGQHEAGNDVVKVNWGENRRPPSVWEAHAEAEKAAAASLERIARLRREPGITSPIAEQVYDEQKLLIEVTEEFRRATRKYGHFHSGHEGYGVIAEELDELWDDVKESKASIGYPEQTRREAIQVAAMAMRFALDLCSTPPPCKCGRTDGRDHLCSEDK